jgi:hypothetical protein
MVLRFMELNNVFISENLEFLEILDGQGLGFGLTLYSIVGSFHC